MTNSGDKIHSEDFVQFMSFAGAFMRSIEHKREDRILCDPFAEPLTRQIAPQLGPLSVLNVTNAPLIPDQHEIVVADVNDFNWEERLLSAGFDSNLPTFWALEGQTMYLDRSSNVALLKTIDVLSASDSEIWGDIGGQALQEGAIAAIKQVDELSQTELGTHLFKLGEDDAMHGVFSQLPWELELQANLGMSGTHFNRKWEPIPSVSDKAPVPFSFVHGVKKEH
ncbi:hypothetical protein PInf_017082 [Phytophthora infestans]|nr:hypothetical protein PInf_017082 [Phytophthora infestans]